VGVGWHVAVTPYGFRLKDKIGGWSTLSWLGAGWQVAVTPVDVARTRIMAGTGATFSSPFLLLSSLELSDTKVYEP